MFSFQSFKGAALTGSFLQQCFLSAQQPYGPKGQSKRKERAASPIVACSQRDTWKIGTYKQPLCQFVQDTIQSWAYGHDNVAHLDEEVKVAFNQWVESFAERQGTLCGSVNKEIIMSERTIHEYLQSLLVLGYVFHNFYVRYKLERTFQQNELERLNRYIDELEAKVPVASSAKVLLNAKGGEQEVAYNDYIQHYIESARLVVQTLMQQEQCDQPLMEAFRSIDRDTFLDYLPRKENVQVYHAMDEYKIATLGSQVTLDNFWHEGMMATRTLTAGDYQELAGRTILMGYLLREYEMRMDRVSTAIF